MLLDRQARSPLAYMLLLLWAVVCAGDMIWQQIKADATLGHLIMGASRTSLQLPKQTLPMLVLMIFHTVVQSDHKAMVRQLDFRPHQHAACLLVQFPLLVTITAASPVCLL